VVGEDLGTVPPGFRERMAEAGVLSYRVLYFEGRNDGSRVPPEDYPPLALATVGSHDLATLRGWWQGLDIGLKDEKGLYPGPDEAAAQFRLRATDRGRLLDALRLAGCPLPAGFDADSRWDDDLDLAVHAFLARTRAAVAMAQLDDLAGNLQQVNLPGSTDQYPNWRRKLAMSLEELAQDTNVRAVTDTMATIRGRNR
jgi:4-alpha-glucanotransferase